MSVIAAPYALVLSVTRPSAASAVISEANAALLPLAPLTVGLATGAVLNPTLPFILVGLPRVITPVPNALMFSPMLVSVPSWPWNEDMIGGLPATPPVNCTLFTAPAAALNCAINAKPPLLPRRLSSACLHQGSTDPGRLHMRPADRRRRRSAT